MWGEHVNSMRPPGSPQVKVDFAVLAFNQIADQAERYRFNAMPTTFHLQSSQVERLRILAGQLQMQSPEFQSFLRDMHSVDTKSQAASGPGSPAQANGLP